MDVLCGHHAKDPEICRWVVENCSDCGDNITVRAWVEASKKLLESLEDK